jgi:hypothetical protein
VWVAWTVAGVLGFVLALMCSGRVVQRARQRRMQQARVGGVARGRWMLALLYGCQSQPWSDATLILCCPVYRPGGQPSGCQHRPRQTAWMGRQVEPLQRHPQRGPRQPRWQTSRQSPTPTFDVPPTSVGWVGLVCRQGTSTSS